MEDWQHRVITERNDLEVKIEKLTDFIRSYEFKSVPVVQAHLMIDQLAYMNLYYSTLCRRIMEWL